MPKYRAKVKHYINETGEIIPKGSVFEYAGKPGRQLEAMDADAEKAIAEAAKPVEYEGIDNRPFGVAASAPARIKSHPTLPNPEGSSGEEEGDEVPYAALKRQERQIAAQNAAAMGDTREEKQGRGRGRGRPKKYGKRGRAVAHKTRPQSDVAASADDAGTE